MPKFSVTYAVQIESFCGFCNGGEVVKTSKEYSCIVKAEAKDASNTLKSFWTTMLPDYTADVIKQNCCCEIATEAHSLGLTPVSYKIKNINIVKL